jgi:hypothetical protein
MPRYLTLVALVWLALSCEELASAGEKMIAVSMKKIPCHTCHAHGLPDSHGDVWVVYDGGRKERVTRSGLCRDPKLSPDGLTCGLGTVTHNALWEDIWYSAWPDAVVLYRGGKCLRTIRFNGFWVGAWKFWNNEQQVALRSGSLPDVHADYYDLYDIATGALVDKGSVLLPLDITGEYPPAWAATWDTLVS